MSTATPSSSTAMCHFTPEQMDYAIRGVVRRSITDEDEAELITKRMRRVLNGETTVEEVSQGGSVIPKHLLEAHVKAAQVALEHIVDGIAEAIAAFKRSSVDEESNDASAAPDLESSTAEKGHKSSWTPSSSNTRAEPGASRSSETLAAQSAPRSRCVKKAPRLWGPLSKRKPTAAAVVTGLLSPSSATENSADKAYLESFAAPDCFVDIGAEIQARMEEILAQICDECGKAVRDMKRHKEEVHAVQGQKRFACEKCPTVYVHERGLQRHMKEKHRRESKRIPVLPSVQDGESDDYATSVLITEDLAVKIANSAGSIDTDEPAADGQEGSDSTEESPVNIPTPAEEPIDVDNTDDFYGNLAFDLEMAKMDNSSMEFDLHLSDASDPVEGENVESIPIIDNNNDGELFSDGPLPGSKNNASGQKYEDFFVDIENLEDEGA